MAGPLSLRPVKTAHSITLWGVVTAAALQRFGYYGIRSILIVYLTTELRMSDQRAGQVYGVFYGSLFLTSLLGGLLGDTALGYKFVASLGFGFVLSAHLCLAIGTLSATFVALILYSIGFGLFDPNLNAALAENYRTDKSLRDSAYSVLYSGINVGAMLGPLICGYIAVQINWSYGFLSGGFVSLIGLLLFRMSVHKPDLDKTNPHSTVSSISIANDPNEDGRTTMSTLSLLATLGVIALLAITFWAVFDQLGSSVTLLVQRHVRRNLGSFEVPAGYVQSINPFLVIVLGLLWSFVIKRRSAAKHGRDAKVLVFGLILLGTGFGLLALGSAFVDLGTQATISWIWILVAVVFATVGELLFATRSFSVVAGLSPAKRRALILGAWSATFGIGAYLSGTMAGFMNTFARLSTFFAISACVCWLTGLAFLVVVRVMRSRMMIS